MNFRRPIFYFSLIVVAMVFQSPVLFGKQEPKAIAQKWLDGHAESGLVLVEKFTDRGFRANPVAGGKSTIYTLTQPGYRVSLGFSAALQADTTLKEARELLKYVALDKLPLPGTEFPEGWNVIPRTSVSSFKEGVEILDVRDGQITLRIKTGFFAIYGRDTNVLVPADAPSPEGSYFQIRQKFPLDLTIQAPVESK